MSRRTVNKIMGPASKGGGGAAEMLADDMGLTFVTFHDLFLKAATANGTDGKFWA